VSYFTLKEKIRYRINPIKAAIGEIKDVVAVVGPVLASL
jgi:hypothetical protein